MSKKIFFAYLISIVLILTPLRAFAKELYLTYDGAVHKYVGNIYSLKVNGEIVDSDIPPIIMNDRSLVPVRAIFESLGAEVHWDSKERKVLVSYRGSDVELTIDSHIAIVNGKETEMEVPAKIINDRTMVPLRFVGEQLNMNVGFDNDKKEISIDSYDLENLANLQNVKHIRINENDRVTMSLDKNTDYRILRASNPERIVVDFPNTKISGSKANIKPNSKLIGSIYSEQFDVGTARVVLDLIGNSQYSVMENEENLILNVTPYEDRHLGEKNKLNILYINESDYELILIPIESYKGYNDFVLESPDRIVIDIPNAVVDESLARTEINGTIVQSVRCGEPEKNIGRVVIDTIKKPYYKIIEDDGRLVVCVSGTPITGELALNIPPATRDGGKENDGKNFLMVNHYNRGNYEEIEFNVNKYENYSIYKEIENNRIIVEIPDALAPVKEQVIEVKNDLIEDISYVSYSDKVARAFINLNGASLYTVSEETGRFVLKITYPDGGRLEEDKEEDVEKEAGENVEEDAGKDIKDEGKDTEEDTEEDKVWEFDKNDKSYLTNRVSVVYERDQGYNKVMIGFSKGYEDYSVSKLSNPERIVIDIPNASADKDQKTISVNSNYINTIRYAQFEEGIARVVIEVPAGVQYRVEELKTRLDVYVTKANIKNVSYYGNMDRVHFILQGAKLTEGGSNLKRLYTGKYDLNGKRYTITFPSHLADIGTGTIIIKDGIVDSVKITKDTTNNQTSIEFNTEEKYHFEIIYRGDVNNTAINLLKPASKEDRLVVIDAGHGGREPGAVHGGIEEKDLNLDIALRLNKLLKEQGVKTFMIREDDRYVGLYERAYIANSLNAALFLSIHNNAFYSSHKGTETLYFPPKAGDTGFTGKRFAEIIQHHVVTTLNTNNRKIIERPNLVVLKATTMPAALAEIAFMTNPDDMARLKTPEFRQKAAEALCKAVLQALDEMD